MKELISFMLSFFFLFQIAYSQQHTLAKQWDKRYGGFLDDEIYSCIRTSNGSYLLGGSTYSGIGGNKTQDNWDTTFNTYDSWVVKIDSVGIKLWDKRFGGEGDDDIASVQQTIDGGYILVGESNSNMGGDKTQPSQGGFDYWMVKIDAQGNKLWDKRFGGTADDFLYDMQPTKDGGYILGGISQSDTGGDKTQPNWAIGWYNFWVIKIDSAGNKQWDKVYGGAIEEDLRSILVTPDGGYLLGGWSYSGISGDKTEPNQGEYDYWVIKIDSLGNKQWDKDYGGTDDDQLFSIAATNDGGYLLGGDSKSPADGDKTENNTAKVLSWVVKTDSAGNKQWDKTILLNGNTATARTFQAPNDDYVITSFTNAGVAYFKTQPAWGDSSADYWIVIFRDTIIISGINDLTTNLQLNIYPTPFTSDLNITISQPSLTQSDISIFNLLGQTVYTQHENNLSPTYTKMLDLSYLPNGVYFVEVVIDGEVTVREVIKQ